MAIFMRSPQMYFNNRWGASSMDDPSIAPRRTSGGNPSSSAARFSARNCITLTLASVRSMLTEISRTERLRDGNMGKQDRTFGRVIVPAPLSLAPGVGSGTPPVDAPNTQDALDCVACAVLLGTAQARSPAQQWSGLRPGAWYGAHARFRQPDLAPATACQPVDRRRAAPNWPGSQPRW